MRTAILMIGAAAAGIILGVQWQKRRIRRTLFMFDGPTTSAIVNSFADYLSKRHPRNHRQFLSRLKDNPEAAQAEAVTFSLLTTLNLSPTVNETVNSGGLDFKCTPSTGESFLVEVTSLNAAQAARRTRLPNTAEPTGSSYLLDNRKLWDVVDSKMAQMADSHCAHILVIVSFHIRAGAVFRTLPTQYLLTGQPKLVTNLGEHPSQRTDLADSIFLRPTEAGKIETYRRRLSAVVLVTVAEGQCSATGLVHPDPEIPLRLDGFQDIPFVRLRRWPIVDGRIETEWTVPQPGPATIYLQLVTATT